MEYLKFAAQLLLIVIIVVVFEVGVETWWGARRDRRLRRQWKNDRAFRRIEAEIADCTLCRDVPKRKSALPRLTSLRAQRAARLRLKNVLYEANKVKWPEPGEQN